MSTASPLEPFQRPKEPLVGRTLPLSAVLEGWRGDPRVAQNIVLDEIRPPTLERLVDLPGVGEGLRKALAGRGVGALYSHQAEALTRLREGRHIVVATPTASGKSLCYNLPVVERLAAPQAASDDGESAPGARALYLFPTKALARDQEAALRNFMADAGLRGQGVITYDGDTPADARRAAKERGAVVLTNPDMLHAGILPHHASWARLLSNLEIVVVDELHTYRGVFGSHLANVLRRLQRIARFHGSNPQFVFASATIGNPAGHATRMLGEEVTLVGESGAPTGERHVLCYNPPVVNAELGIRQSYVKATVRLTADLVRAKIPTIVFGQSRNNVEVMLKYLRERVADDGIDASRIVAYRGGYLPGTRRHIEAELRAGSIACVVATNALELGIDIGSLQAVVCAGYPGSIAALWQRFGRGGRRGEPSLALMVASSLPLDQYFANTPEQLVGAPAEQARIDPDNLEILIQHLKCAAFELPFEDGEGFGDVPATSVSEAMEFLSQHRVVHAAPGASGGTTYHWATEAYPANHVSLRSVGWDNYVIIDVSTHRNMGEMDWRSARTMLHEQAIYQHDGAQYQVERLDYENHKAYVRPVKCDYYTTAMTHTKVSVLEEEVTSKVVWGSGVELSCDAGEVSVASKVVGYKKIKFHSHENVGYGEVRLPEVSMHTTACWYTFSHELVTGLGVARPAAIDALRGLGKAMHTVASAGLMIDPRDLGWTLEDEQHGGPFDPSLYMYDAIPGGVGLAPRIYEERESLMVRAAELVRMCPCDGGCPSCVGPVGDPTDPLSRRPVLLRLFEELGL